jgi:hypothetical protein
MVLEGPCVYEDGADATAQSQGWSWSMNHTAGTSPNTVYWNKLDQSASGILATLAISPPSSGAAVIPPYCAGDASYWFDPSIGVSSSYNNNGVMLAEAVVWFGTTINGKTLANAVSVTTAVDTGVNTYHSTGQFTGSGTSGQWDGVSLTIAAQNRKDITGKNILAHIRPSTPKTLQTTDDISRANVKGFAFGISSGGTLPSAATAKVWHVHGAGTNWNSSTFVPIVINDAATAGLIQTTGAYSGTTASRFGFFSSGFGGGIVAPVWQVSSIWQLDTTVVAGGNANNPIGLIGVVKAASTGKERISVLQQGALEALILQPIQFGNGGTDSIYMNLNATVIEFPKQYDPTNKQVFYASTDNVAGITYYAGVGDAIIHTNATVSSQSKYFWGFSASSASSSVATYSFDGTFIIGAGTVTFNAGVNLNGLTFNNCGQLAYTPPALFSNILVTKTSAVSTAYPNGTGAMVLTGTAASLQAQLDKLINCQFTFNTGANAALRLVYTGTGTAISSPGNQVTVTLKSSSLIFNNNNVDIYWDGPGGGVGTLLNFQLSGTAYATTSTYNGSDFVYLQLRRNFVINNLIEGTSLNIYSNTGVYSGGVTSGNTLVATATTVGANPTGLSNITVATDTVYPGRFTATYTYTYTVAIGGTGGLVSTALVIPNRPSSGTILIGQILKGNGVVSTQTLSINSIIGTGGTVTAFYTAQLTTPFIAGQSVTISNTSVSAFNTTVTVASANTTAITFSSITTATGSGGTIFSKDTIIIGQSVAGGGGILGADGTYTLNQPAQITAGTTLSFDTPIYAVVYQLGYQALRPAASLQSIDSALTVDQLVDRQYTNAGGIGA